MLLKEGFITRDRRGKYSGNADKFTFLFNEIQNLSNNLGEDLKKWMRLNGGTVLRFKMHPGGPVPPFKMYPGGTLDFYDTYFFCLNFD